MVVSASDNENIVKEFPNYLANPSKKGDIHDIMIDANEERDETGVDYDCNCDAERNK